MNEPIKLGRFEYCLTVKDLKKSLEFYKKLGFKEKEGNIDEGWQIISHRDCILGLYQGHLNCNVINFRGGDVFAIASYLEKQGLTFEKDAHKESDGSDGAIIRDPDDNVIYFNTAAGEEM